MTFEQMPANAMVWIYASNRLLSSQDQELIRERATQFLNTWTAHDMPVMAAFDLLYGVFTVFMVDKDAGEISGCGIDKSVAFMKKLGAETGIDFFNRMGIELKTGNDLLLCDKTKAARMFEEGTIGSETLTFDKTVSTKEDFMNRFEIPVSESWFYLSILQGQRA